MSRLSILAAFAAATPFLLTPLSAQEAEPSVLRDGSTVSETWTAPDAQGVVRPWFRFSLDGGDTWSRSRATSYDLMLRYESFDPLADELPMVPDALSAGEDNELWIVQYTIKGLEPWREEIRSMGGVDHRYLGNHANIWRMDAETAKSVSELPYVRWVGPFHAAYKLENEMMEAYTFGKLEHRRYNIVVGEWGPAEKAQLSDLIIALGGTVVEAYETGWIVSAVLSPEMVLEIVQSPLVLGIDRWTAPEEDMNNGRVMFGANHVESVAGYTGQGLVAEVMDGGLDQSHVDWGTTPIITTSTGGSDSHGTCTFGINFADGDSAGGNTRGLVPSAQGLFADYSNFGNRYVHTQGIINNHGAVYQSNSWGGGRTTSYTSTSQEMDDIIFDLDFTILQSQSNAGDQMSRPQAWAKNIIAVGGVRHQNDQNWANDSWSFGGSIGPAADGRIKPDMACWYDGIWTSDADPGGYASGDDHTGFGGTSGATPMVAGHIGLIYQMWANGDFGNATNGNPLDVFGNRPHNTTAKALLVNGARQWDFSGANHDLTRVHQGWGGPDVKGLYDGRNETFVINEEFVLTDGASAAWTVTVPAGAPEFQATLVYSDPPGTTSSNLHRINDLSLKVTSPTGTIYWGNNGLLASMTSTSGGSSNTKDTVENVILANPVAGDWQVTVIADEVNQDSHVETPAIDADFALVVTPVTGSTGSEPTDTISLSGPFQPSVGGPYGFNYTNAPANSPVWLVWSLSNAGQTAFGHQFNVGTPYTIIRNGNSGIGGAGGWLISFPAAAAGQTVYFELAANDSGDWYDSNLLQIDVQ